MIWHRRSDAVHYSQLLKLNTSIFALAISRHPLLKLSPFLAHNASMGSTSTIICSPVAIVIPELYTRVHNSLS